MILLLAFAAQATDHAAVLDAVLERSQGGAACFVAWDPETLSLKMQGTPLEVVFEVDEDTSWRMRGGRDGRRNTNQALNCLQDAFAGVELGDGHRVNVFLVRNDQDEWVFDTATCGSPAAEVNPVRAFRHHMRGCAAVFGEGRERGVLAVRFESEGPVVEEPDEAVSACISHGLGELGPTRVHRAVFNERLDMPSVVMLDQVTGWTGLAWGAPPPRTMRIIGEDGPLAVYERPADRYPPPMDQRYAATPSRVRFAGHEISSLEYSYFDDKLFRVSFTVVEPQAVTGIRSTLEQHFGRPRAHGKRMGWEDPQVALLFDPDSRVPTYSFIHKELAAAAKKAGVDTGQL